MRDDDDESDESPSFVYVQFVLRTVRLVAAATAATSANQSASLVIKRISAFCASTRCVLIDSVSDDCEHQLRLEAGLLGNFI